LLQHSTKTATVISLHQLTTQHYSHSLLSAVLLCATLLQHPVAAAVDRYLLSAGPTAANPLYAVAVFDVRERETDRHHTVTYILPRAVSINTQQSHTHTHTFNSHLSRTAQVSRYQKSKTNLDFTEARDREWQWHQLDHMQVCTLLQTDSHSSTSPLSFLQAGCPSCNPTNSIKALKVEHSATSSLNKYPTSTVSNPQSIIYFARGKQKHDRKGSVLNKYSQHLLCNSNGYQ